MKKIDEKKQKIYDVYKENLNILTDNGFYKSQRDTYLCPICLKPKLLHELTLEDYPPKSVGGKANLLTCSKCNNEAGSKIDFHLNNIMDFQTKEENRYRIEIFNGKKFNGLFNKKTGKVTYPNNINDPNELEKELKTLKAGSKINLKYMKPMDDLRIKLALLKTSYLFAFEKFGYVLILDKNYDIIRYSIINNDTTWVEKNIKLFNTVEYDKENNLHEMIGAFIFTDTNFESLFVGFKLTKNQIDYYCSVLLPLPNRNLSSFSEISKKDEILIRWREINSIRDFCLDNINSFINMYSLMYD